MPDRSLQISPPKDGHFRAEATNVQASALARHLGPEAVAPQVRAHIGKSPFKRCATADIASARKWLSNAWNTERMLRWLRRMDDDGQNFAVQWAFPQAYYASYCQVLALYSVIGKTEQSHKSVMRQFGLLAKQGKLPDCFCCYADGGRNEITLHGADTRHQVSPVELNLNDPASVSNQIAQLLRSTRKNALEDQKSNHKIKTSTGSLKKSFRREDWAVVSGGLGPTTILSYLYRKRIKANYHDIESLLHPDIHGEVILVSLATMVGAFGLLCEGYILHLMTTAEVASLKGHPLYDEAFLKYRRELLSD